MKYTISIHTKHDANMTISAANTIIQYIEFEKVAGKRYFSFSEDEMFEKEFQTYILPFLKELKNDITKINFCWLSEFQKSIFLQEFPECEIECKKHHISHAHSLYAFTEPRPNDLIVSFDGGGDDEDFFKLFHFENRQMRMMKEIKLNLGTPYRILGLISDEIKSAPVFEYDTNLHLPGKIMGLAPLGTVDENYIEPVENFYWGFRNCKARIYEKLKSLLDELRISYDNNLKVDKFVARNVLRTSQKVFENLFFENAIEIFDEKYDRILLVGGCSLNVKLNTEIYLKTQKNIFVPPISGDCGISLGAALSDMNLNEFTPYKNAFIGLECSDDITPYIEKYNPKHVSTNKLADLLAKGKIVATIVGKIEAGARSLGNRSLLASPLCKGMKDKLNEIKEREFFRPIAPIVSKEKQSFYFGKSPISKYMTFTPKINPEFQDKLLEIVHYDSTCRIQTATREDGFIYDLLKDFGNLTGIEVLINTSFNVKGKPVTNNLADAFDLLETSGIDYLYINGLLFKQEMV